jgi:8-oxo-dGTP diphosphatase
VSDIEPSAIRDVYLFVRRADTLLLLLREGTGYQDGAWCPPAGKVEPGETYREAGVRELREETGLVVGPSDLRLVHLLDRSPEPGERWHWVGAFFEVDRVEGIAINREPEKCRAIAWHRPEALPGPMVDYVAHVLAALTDGIGYSEWRAPSS